ncbi:Hypothetical predicted protein [Octopus vulgaris]|uniref:Uncharacterized protein n=1 Tax=Octopus vulgaris TaxID=6645 RepID=A0AA36B8B5_OCTVU|nr:Hypothetical predicted protein [Octopus vulgaris]
MSLEGSEYKLEGKFEMDFPITYSPISGDEESQTSDDRMMALSKEERIPDRMMNLSKEERIELVLLSGREGWSYRKIAEEFNLPHPCSLVRKTLPKQVAVRQGLKYLHKPGISKASRHCYLVVERTLVRGIIFEFVVESFIIELGVFTVFLVAVVGCGRGGVGGAGRSGDRGADVSDGKDGGAFVGYRNDLGIIYGG